MDLVLSIIQEKINNPSPEDPFQPEIAQVGLATLPKTRESHPLFCSN
jgi:hypothetical protein